MVRAGMLLTLVAAPALAQAPPAGPAPAAPPAAQQRMDPVLWQHLQAWERVMKGAGNFVSERGTMTEFDARLKSSKVNDATIWCLKPNLARMGLAPRPPAGQKPDPAQATTIICDGRAVFEYDAPNKRVTEYPLGPNGGIGDNLLLEFVSGSITAFEASQRFTIDWLNQQDPNYLVLELTPLRDKDKAEFDKLTLVLVKPGLPAPFNQSAYLPRTAVLTKPFGQKVETWDFPAPMLNALKAVGQPISRADFQKIDPLPKDWKVEKAGQAPTAMPPAGPRAPRPGRP